MQGLWYENLNVLGKGWWVGCQWGLVLDEWFNHSQTPSKRTAAALSHRLHIPQSLMNPIQWAYGLFDVSVL